MTRTVAHYFDRDQVDDTIGEAFKTLDADYRSRKDAIGEDDRIAIEARLEILKGTWTLFREVSPS